MKSNKVVHLSSVHKASDTRIFHKECKSLQKSGFDVTLIIPNEKDEIVDGVKIVSVDIPKRRLYRLVFTNFQILLKAISQNAKIYHIHDPELIFVGVMLKILGYKVIYDVHENFKKNILTKYWVPGFLKRTLSKIYSVFEKLAIFSFDLIITASENILKGLNSPKKIAIKYYPDSNEFKDFLDVQEYDQRAKKIVWTGSTSVERGAFEMVKAMEYLNNNVDYSLDIAGKFSPESLKNDLENLEGWERTNFLGWIEHEEVKKMLVNARIGLCIIHPNQINNVEGHPRKLFEYMGAGLPIIASNFPKWRKILEGNNCGIVVNPLEPKDIAEKITYLINNEGKAKKMGLNGINIINERFNWERQEEKLISSYKKLII